MDKVNKDNKPKGQAVKKDSFDDWKPLNLGGLKSGAKDWVTKDYRDEMMNELYKGEQSAKEKGWVNSEKVRDILDEKDESK